MANPTNDQPVTQVVTPPVGSSEDIRIHAQLLSGLQIEKATCFRWIREEIPVLVSKYFRAGKFIVEELTTTTEYEMYHPEHTLVLLDRMINENDVQVDDYDVINGGVVIYSPGTYKILYFAQPELPETEYDPIDLPLQYVAGLKYFIAARIRARVFGQTDDSAVSFYKEFQGAMEDAARILNRRQHRRKRMPPGRRTL